MSAFSSAPAPSVKPTTVHPVKSRAAASFAAAAPLDILILAVAGMTLTYVGRIQVLWPAILPVLRLALVSTVIAAVAWGLDTDRRRRLALPWRLLHMRLMAALGCWVVVSVPFAAYPTRALDFIRFDYWTLFLFFCLTALALRSLKDLERIAFVHLIGMVIYSLVVLQRFQVEERSGRLGSLPTYDSNDYSMLLVCTLPFAFHFLAKRGAVFSRLIALGAIPLFIVGLARSGSRGGFLAFLVTIGFLLTRHRWISKKLRIAAVVGAVGMLLVSASSTYWEMMNSILQPSKDYNWVGASGRGRMEVWRRGVGYMLSSPVTGVGAKNFEFAESRSSHNRAREAEGRGWVWAAPHNSFVQVGAELGVVGLGLFIAVLWTITRSLRELARPPGQESDAGRFGVPSMALTLLASLYGYLVAGFFLSQAYSSLLYSLLGMSIALLKLQPAGRPTPTPEIRANRPASRSGRSVGRSGLQSVAAKRGLAGHRLPPAT